MKYKLIIVISILITGYCFGQAQNRWNVYAGGSLSHVCETPWMSTDKTYGWGGGAFVGAGYEINFNPNWSLSPQLEFSFDDNGAVLNAKEDLFFNNHASWQNYWSVSIPVIAAYRVALGKQLKLRIGAGPYLQEAIKGKWYRRSYDVVDKESMPGDFAKRFNIGISGEVAIETGNHFSYMFRTKYPFLKQGWFRNTINLSIGIRYSF